MANSPLKKTKALRPILAPNYSINPLDDFAILSAAATAETVLWSPVPPEYPLVKMTGALSAEKTWGSTL
jgi:hypothetical protein